MTIAVFEWSVMLRVFRMVRITGVNVVYIFHIGQRIGKSTYVAFVVLPVLREYASHATLLSLKFEAGNI